MPDAARATFFKMVFGTHEGYVCVSIMPISPDGEWADTFFEWPKDASRMETFIEASMDRAHMYFCPQIFTKPKRRKDCVKTTPTAWADLDSCPPSALKITPTVTIESSPSRYQAYWRFDDDFVAPYDAQDISRRIAYAHADEGADKSGWDLTQVLRIPNTLNYKYLGTTTLAPTVRVAAYNIDEVPTLLEMQETYPQVEQFAMVADIPQPVEPESATDVMMRNLRTIHPYAQALFGTQPKEGEWSTALWNMELMLFEAGLTIEEVYAVAREAQCNKYERDGRGDLVLWKEVLRAKEKYEFDLASGGALVNIFEGPGQLLTDEERDAVKNMEPSFIENYIAWATEASDASVQYHQASAFVTLSSLLASKIRLPTGPDVVQLNLWFMILGDTTLTRKSTSMNMGINLIAEIDENAVLATDGSIEGIFRAMSQRPGRSSVFLRDEFSGLLKGMSTRDYMSGMMEALTKLYDGTPQKRILSKEVLEIKEPVFILFTGGIKTAILELFNKDHVISGFLPRFIFISAKADISKIKPLGPPTQKNDRGRKDLLTHLRNMHDHYHNATMMHSFAGVETEVPKRWKAKLTEDAWNKYNQFEMSLLHYGEGHNEADMMMPALSRLCMSGLKTAVLVAASRRLEDDVIVTEQDILHAFNYVEAWRDYLIEVIDNIGKTPYEKVIDSVVSMVYKEPGIARGTIMRVLRLSSKIADDVFSTAEQRNIIKAVSYGKSFRLYPPDFLTGE